MRRLVLILIGVLAAICLIKPGTSATADAPVSSWLGSDPPVVKIIDPDVPITVVSSLANKDCSPNTKFITRPARPPVIAESSHLACAVQTAFGQQSSSDGQTILQDTNLAGQIKNSSGGTLATTAIPNSDHIIYVSGTLYGSYRFIVKDFAQNSSVKVQADGSIYHQLKPGVVGSPVKDPAGNMMVFSSHRFSANGKWMIGEVPFRGLTRVNIETGETMVFGDPYNHSAGVRPNYTSAISSDGRYVIAADPAYDILKFYDLASCQFTADRANCAVRDLLSLVRSQISGFKNILHFQFSTDYSVRFYARYADAPGADRYGYYTLGAPDHIESQLDYLALGDSFASGEGTFSYKPFTDVEQPFNKCHLSLLSYPYLLAAQAGLNSVESVACSGAKMKDIIAAGEKQSDGKEDPSFDQQIFHGFLPGYRPQLSFVQNTKPKAVTVSISGNDIGFGKILLACLMPGTCYSTPQERLDLIHTINTKFDQLVSTYRQVKEESATDARVYAIGYPSLAYEDGNCALNVRLNREEIVFSNQIAAYLNSVIEKAAAKARVSYINTENTFAGHRLCETVSSDVAVNGLTLGDDKTFSIPLKFSGGTLDVYLTGRESYHPNQLGHRLYRDLISSATNNLALGNPQPDSAQTNPSNQDAAAVIGGSQGLTPRKIIFEDTMADNLVLVGNSNPVKTTGLMPFSNAIIWLEADKTTFAPVSSTGELFAALDIPAETSPGLYLLHVEGKNPAGEYVDVQEFIYVAASLQDINGNDTPNQDEKCSIFEASGTDQDKDSVDDACDNLISGPPTILQQTLTSIGLGAGFSAASSFASSSFILPAKNPAVLGVAISLAADTLASTFSPVGQLLGLTKNHGPTAVRPKGFSPIFLIVLLAALAYISFKVSRKLWRKPP